MPARGAWHWLPISIRADLTAASAQTLNLLENDFVLPGVLGVALFGVLAGLAVVAGRILPGLEP